MIIIRTLSLLPLRSISKLQPKFKNYSQYSILPTSLTMAEPHFPGQPLSHILERLESFAPLSLAESWDNVGLLVDPMESEPVKKILLTNDLTEDVLDEAIKLEARLIISYHPNIFQGLKRVTSRTWKERIVVKCIKHKIAVFSPHTSWDAVSGGVNDWLANAVPFQSCNPITENTVGRICELAAPVRVKEVVDRVKKHINIPNLSLALARNKDEDHLINSIAVCAGSGSSVLRGAKAGLYLTGEMSHHDVLEATQNGTHVILTNHSNSERGFLKIFKNNLQDKLLEKSVQVFVSEVDCDPLKAV